MTEPLLEDYVAPFKLQAFYVGPGEFRVVVTHDDGRVAEGISPCTWTPTFGIDVADMSMIMEKAEALCVSLES